MCACRRNRWSVMWGATARSPRAGGPRLLLRGNRQPLATLGPAPLQHDPAVLGAHAHEESVGPPAAAVIGLKRTLHREQSSEQGPEPNGRTTNSSEPRFYLSIAPRADGGLLWLPVGRVW